jgi:hypothetical protein
VRLKRTCRSSSQGVEGVNLQVCEKGRDDDPVCWVPRLCLSSGTSSHNKDNYSNYIIIGRVIIGF